MLNQTRPVSLQNIAKQNIAMSYTIKIHNTDISFTSTAEQPVLDAAHQADVLISYGCKNGLCGSCEAIIKQGEVIYPDGLPRGLTTDEQKQGKTLLCKAIANSDLTIEARIDKPNNQPPVRILPVKIQQKTQLANDVMQLQLQLPSTEEPFEFLAGQWLNFVMKDGRKRAFSIANIPNIQKQIEIHIRHIEGGIFTDFVFNQLKTGDILKIEGPQGSFYYHDDYRDIIMVAGGTGFAPLKGIIEFLQQQKNKPNIHLYWGAKSKKDLYMHKKVKHWQQQGLIKYTPVLSKPLNDDNWKGKTGYVHEAIIKDYHSLKDNVIYMAGPPAMIKVAKPAFLKQQARNKNIYFDSFEYSNDADKAN